MDGFFKRARELAERLDSWDRNSKIMIIGHRDGDGISATSVLLQGLRSLGFKKIIPHIILSPEIEVLDSLLVENAPKYVITCDIGSAFADSLKKQVLDFVITDHHPNKAGNYDERQLNCINFGMDDEIDASGSTTAFSLLMSLFNENFWKAEIGQVILGYAISGAISDFQFQKKVGKINDKVLKMAIDNGAVKVSKDIAIFGRGMYPVAVAIHRAGIPGFSNYDYCRGLVSSKIQTKEEEVEVARRIIDLDDEEKKSIIDLIINRLSAISNNIDIMKFLKKEVIHEVYDLEALRGWDCTRLSDGRFSLDPREILHRINYCCRLGHWDLALDLLNKKKVNQQVFNEIEELHKVGDQEVAVALQAFEKGEISMRSGMQGKVVLVDFTNYIFYDEVGVVAGVIMKKNRDIEIILSSCLADSDGNYKVSVRAREKIWDMIDADNDFADANKVYEKTKAEYDLKYGGHRFAMSRYMPKEAMPKLFENMIEYYKTLK